MSDPRSQGAQLLLRTRSAGETQAVGAAIAGLVQGGDVIALSGELGAGKTCLIQGSAAALGVSERVTSPSFLLRRDYRGSVPIIHLDVYRLDTLQEVMELGFDEVGDRTTVTFIEWGDAVAQLLPADYLEIDLRHADGVAAPAEDPAADDDEIRLIEVRAHGPDWRRRMERLRDELAEWLDGGAA